MPHHRLPRARRRSIDRRLFVFLPLLSLVVAAACGGGETGEGKTSVVAAGDIAGCFWRGDEATARLLDGIGGTVLALGDNVYQRGTPDQYTDCYGPTWGRHLERTRAVMGNHDYRTDHGAPYYAYFGERAGPAGKGWYSFDQDGWHVVALNSEVPMGEGSEQLAWLRADLAAHPVRCTLALMHRPRFSTGDHGDSERVKTAFRALYEAGVDVVLSGHDH
ncbi:MAG TPA: metallophosphoesterase, partial [Longimicrobium sp.]|nr:metallophosphoesterase [Longimicrobium sp.]